jgi:hypothetical protein
MRGGRERDSKEEEGGYGVRATREEFTVGETR